MNLYDETQLSIIEESVKYTLTKSPYDGKSFVAFSDDSSADDYDDTYYERDLKKEDWAKNYAKVYNDLFLSDIKTTAINIQNYWTPWKEYYNEYILSHTQILDQGLDESNLGDKYTGYYVVYAMTGTLGESKYALVSITEYDDDSRYEYQILATADSLKEINQYLE